MRNKDRCGCQIPRVILNHCNSMYHALRMHRNVLRIVYTSYSAMNRMTSIETQTRSTITKTTTKRKIPPNPTKFNRPLVKNAECHMIISSWVQESLQVLQMTGTLSVLLSTAFSCKKQVTFWVMTQKGVRVLQGNSQFRLLFLPLRKSRPLRRCVNSPCSATPASSWPFYLLFRGRFYTSSSFKRHWNVRPDPRAARTSVRLTLPIRFDLFASFIWQFTSSLNSFTEIQM